METDQSTLFAKDHPYDKYKPCTFLGNWQIQIISSSIAERALFECRDSSGVKLRVAKKKKKIEGHSGDITNFCIAGACLLSYHSTPTQNSFPIMDEEWSNLTPAFFNNNNSFITLILSWKEILEFAGVE